MYRFPWRNDDYDDHADDADDADDYSDEDQVVGDDVDTDVDEFTVEIFELNVVEKLWSERRKSDENRGR